MTPDQIAAIAARRNTNPNLVAAIADDIQQLDGGYGYDRHDGADLGQPGTRPPLRIHRVRGHAPTTGAPT